MGYSCVTIGVLDVINIGGVTYAITLGVGNVTGTIVGATVGTFLGTTVVWVVSGCMVLNGCANLLMASNWLSLIAKGVCGQGLLITCISSLEVLVAFSVAYNPEIMRHCGKTPPRLHLFPPWCCVCSICSIGSDPYTFRCNTLVLHVTPKFYAVEFFMYYNLYSRWHKRCFVEVKLSLKCCVC